MNYSANETITFEKTSSNNPENAEILDERSLDYDDDNDLINLHSIEADDEISQRLRTVDEISRELEDVVINAGR